MIVTHLKGSFPTVQEATTFTFLVLWNDKIDRSEKEKIRKNKENHCMSLISCPVLPFQKCSHLSGTSQIYVYLPGIELKSDFQLQPSIDQHFFFLIFCPLIVVSLKRKLMSFVSTRSAKAKRGNRSHRAGNESAQKKWTVPFRSLEDDFTAVAKVAGLKQF